MLSYGTSPTNKIVNKSKHVRTRCVDKSNSNEMKATPVGSHVNDQVSPTVMQTRIALNSLPSSCVYLDCTLSILI